MLSLRVDGGDGGARGEDFGTRFARRKQRAPRCGNDWCVYLIALRLRVRSIGAIEPPKQTLTGPYRRVFAVKQCYKGLQLGTEGTEPNTSSAGKNRGRRRAPGCLFFSGGDSFEQALHLDSCLPGAAPAPRLKRVVIRSPAASAPCAV